MIRLPIGQYFERFLDWAVVNCADFTRWCSGCIDSVVDGLKNIFCAPPEWALPVSYTHLTLPTKAFV